MKQLEVVFNAKVTEFESFTVGHFRLHNQTTTGYVNEFEAKPKACWRPPPYEHQSLLICMHAHKKHLKFLQTKFERAQLVASINRNLSSSDNSPIALGMLQEWARQSGNDYASGSSTRGTANAAQGQSKGHCGGRGFKRQHKDQFGNNDKAPQVSMMTTAPAHAL